jgi:pimeloyl-ACP methyl ester carboxylesterase
MVLEKSNSSSKERWSLMYTLLLLVDLEKEAIWYPAILDTHILDIAQVLDYEDLHDAIMVGHSYSGLVISGAAEQMAKRIKRLVYLDGYIPEDGKTAFDLITWFKRCVQEKILEWTGKDWLVQSYDPTVWGVTTADDIAWMNSRLSPMPWHTHDQPLRINNPEAKKIPRSYICCTEFKDFHFIAQKQSYN